MEWLKILHNSIIIDHLIQINWYFTVNYLFSKHLNCLIKYWDSERTSDDRPNYLYYTRIINVSMRLHTINSFNLGETKWKNMSNRIPHRYRGNKQDDLMTLFFSFRP